MRIILFTGKGGVGKTTVAAATGLKIAESGKECLVISTDPAHSLSDSFDVEIGPEPREIIPNLFAQEIDVQFELKRYWGEVRDYLVTLFRTQGLDDVIAEELAILPGFDELASLLYLLKYYEEGNYDAVILDCAPTGETLRLLSFPEMARWYMERFFGIEKKILKIVRPVAESIAKIPMPSEDVMNSIEDLYKKLAVIKTILERDETSIRLVCLPEKMVFKETQRAYTYLNLFGYNIDLMIINKVIPEVKNGFLREWREIQEKYLKMIEDTFPVPMKIIRLHEREAVGIDILRYLSEELYGEENPMEVYSTDKPMKLYKEKDDYVLSLRLPFVSKNEIEIMTRGEELIILAKNWKRILFLPHVLVGKEPSGAAYRDGRLIIKFREITET